MGGLRLDFPAFPGCVDGKALWMSAFQGLSGWQRGTLLVFCYVGGKVEIPRPFRGCVGGLELSAEAFINMSITGRTSVVVWVASVNYQLEF